MSGAAGSTKTGTKRLAAFRCFGKQTPQINVKSVLDNVVAVLLSVSVNFQPLFALKGVAIPERPTNGK